MESVKLENFYDGEFLRAKTSVNGEISRYLYYNGELQAETYDNDTVKTRYILGYGIAGSETEGRDGSHAYHLDEQNSTAYITGNQRTIENFYEYDAFGSLRQHSEEVKNRILYTGQQYDQETGQYYLRARFYNPVVGRFMQEDVYRGDGLNLYAYCGNNPVVYYDSEGASKKKIRLGAVGGAYNEVDANGGEIHHMPADSISPYGTGAGPGIRMKQEDHWLTKSWGSSKEAKAYRKVQEELIKQGRFKEAQDMDIADVRKKFNDKYDKEIAEMEAYTDKLLKKRPVNKELEKKKKREARKKNKDTMDDGKCP